MEMFPAGWLTEFEMQEENSDLIDNMDTFDDLTPQRLATLFEVDFQNSEGLSSRPIPTTSSNTNAKNSSFVRKAAQNLCEKPTEQLKSATTDSWNSSTTEHTSSPEASSFQNASQFGNSVGSAKLKDQAMPSEKKRYTSKSKNSQGNYVNDKCAPKAGNGRKRANSSACTLDHVIDNYVNDKCAPKAGNGRKRANSSAATLDHVIAERKRREKLTQQFIALSAIVPGLKRMDKVSVLEDCMKYVKNLQERVKTLEEQTSRTNVESAVFVKKYLISCDSDSSSTDETSSNVSHEPLPEVEARISGRNVLIRIHCEKRKGIMAQTLLETEKLNLLVIGSNVMPFGSSTLDITLLAEMDAEFNLTVTGLVRKLRSSIVEFMGKNVPLI